MDAKLMHRDVGGSLNSLESLVDGPEPADVGAGSEHEQPNDGHAEVCDASAAKHPGEAADEVHSQCGAIDWGGENTQPHTCS